MSTPAAQPTAASSFPALVDVLGLAVVVTDRAGTVVHLSAATTRLLGVPAAERLLGRPVLEELFAIPDRPRAAEAWQQVVAAGRWEGPLGIPAATGSAHVTVTAWVPSPAAKGEEPGSMLVLTGQPQHATEEDRAPADRAGRLARVTKDLLAARDVSAVAAAITGSLTDAAEAAVTSVSVIDGDDLRLIALRGARPGTARRWARYPLAAHTPAGDCVRAGHTMVLSGRAEILAEYPDLELATDGERSLVCVPLTASGEVLGVVTWSYPGRRRFTDAELEFLTTMGDSCAQAISRIHAETAARAREQRLRFLADASAQLASSLDYQATLTAVAQLAVPEFADWCVIQLLEDGELRPLAVAHPDNIQAERVRELQHRYPPDPDAPRGAYRVARTGQPELLPEVTDDMLIQVARNSDHLQVLRDLHFRSAVQAPLTVRDRVLGVITWVTGEGERRYEPEDLTFLQDLARRAALAIDNSELHSQLRDVSQQLQNAILPSQLPTPPGWTVSARYLAAGRTDTGGDFYDLVPLENARFAVFVGDVMGRGVQAAATMAQMRAAVRTLIALDPEPRAVMTGLDALFAQYETDQLVTLLYAVTDTVGEHLHVINAGHPAPVILRRDGTSELVTATNTLLLGAGGSSRDLITTPLDPGDTILLFTDGLIERRGEGIDAGHRRLLDALPTTGPAADAFETMLSHLIEHLRDPSRDDDVALVGLHRNA